MKRVFVALDRPDLDGALSLAKSLYMEAAGFKVGLELLTSAGPAAVTQVARLGLPVFADAKLHDIPNTVRGAAAGLMRAGATWLTVHASGGPSAIAAAADEMDGSGGGVLAVTVLTSLSESDLVSLGVSGGVAGQAVRLATMAAESGAAGVVCSPLEVADVRAAVRSTIFTPGVRPGASDAGDQKRVASPVEAVQAGADFLVIGRPITGSNTPLATLAGINESLAQHP